MIKNKFLTKFIKLIVYTLSPFVICFLLLIYPFLKIRFSFQSAERIGEISTQMEVYLSEKQLGLCKKRILDIFILTDLISNYTFIELLKKKVLIYPNFLTHPIYKTLNYLSKYFQFFNHFILRTKYEDNNFCIMRSNINLAPDDYFIKEGESFLKKIGIPQDAKIICLIVRDETYLKKKFPNKDWEYHNYRNCNIENFKDAINFATNKGYYVFRMGETVGKDLDIDNNMYIDYSKKFRTDFLDIYLAYRCTFCITTSTGWDCVPAFTFRKPVLWTNYVPVGNLLTYSPNFIFSFKIHKNKLSDKNLSLKSISESNVSYATNSDLYKNSSIELIENSPNQLVELTKEMIELVDDNHNYSVEELENQKKFWEKYNKFFKLEFLQKNLPYKVNPLWCTSKRIYNGKNISKVGKHFLKDNDFLINNN